GGACLPRRGRRSYVLWHEVEIVALGLYRFVCLGRHNLVTSGVERDDADAERVVERLIQIEIELERGLTAPSGYDTGWQVHVGGIVYVTIGGHQLYMPTRELADGYRLSPPADDQRFSWPAVGNQGTAGAIRLAEVAILLDC